MNALLQLTRFMAFVNELPAIAERADKERASVILDALTKENPEIWAELVYCSKMDSPRTVLAYLIARFPYLGFLKNVPKIEPTIQFLMNFIREREENANNSVATVDQSWTADRYRSRAKNYFEPPEQFRPKS